MNCFLPAQVFMIRTSKPIYLDSVMVGFVVGRLFQVDQFQLTICLPDRHENRARAARRLKAVRYLTSLVGTASETRARNPVRPTQTDPQE
jgi:hypothetical protein